MPDESASFPRLAIQTVVTEFAVEGLAGTVFPGTARLEIDVLPLSSIQAMLDGQLLPTSPINDR